MGSKTNLTMFYWYPLKINKQQRNDVEFSLWLE
jgi:hypothetical protein